MLDFAQHGAVKFAGVKPAAKTRVAVPAAFVVLAGPEALIVEVGHQLRAHDLVDRFQVLDTELVATPLGPAIDPGLCEVSVLEQPVPPAEKP